MGDGVRLQPVGQHEQRGHGGRERLGVLFAPPGGTGHTHGRGHAGRVDIQAGDAFDDDLHHDLPRDRRDAVSPLAEGLD
jgi:hypothetical protein